MASYITNKAPDKYAHPLTGNAIPEKVRLLEPLVQHVPVPLHWLGQAIFGLQTMPWNHQAISNLLPLIFTSDLETLDRLSEMLMEQVVPLLSHQQDTLKSASSRAKLAQMLGFDILKDVVQ